MPTQLTTVVSGRPVFKLQRTNRGTTSMPIATTATRNSASLPAVLARSAADIRPEDNAVSPARRRIPTRSSTTRTDSTSSRSRPATAFSSNALAMIVVDEIATTAPA